MRRVALAGALGLAIAACETARPPSEGPAAPSPDPPRDRGPAGPAIRPPAAGRVVALGDVHGDFEAARAALSLAGAIDAQDRWIGGDLVVVQTGDQLDRGDQEREIVELFERLTQEAAAAGGAVHALNGNHELMNVQGDLRYVTVGGFRQFEGTPGLDLSAPSLAELPAETRARAAAFSPGGPWARKLAGRDVVAVVGDSVFAHGGVLPEHVTYGLERINEETRAWMRGERASPPLQAAGERGVTWIRDFSEDPVDDAECEVLGRALEAIGAARMVVAHTVHLEGITSACDERVWRIDVGMARHYGGTPAVLEIQGTRVRPLSRD
jgi:hypothetical protein